MLADYRIAPRPETRNLLAKMGEFISRHLSELNFLKLDSAMKNKALSCPLDSVVEKVTSAL